MPFPRSSRVMISIKPSAGIEVPLVDTSSSAANRPKLIFFISSFVPIPKRSFNSSAFFKLISTFCFSLRKEAPVSVIDTFSPA